MQRLEVWNDAVTDFHGHLAAWLFGAISMVLGFAAGVLALSGYPIAAVAVGWSLVAGVLLAWTLWRDHMRRSLRAASTAEDATEYFAVFDRRVRTALLVVAIVWTVLMLVEAALL